MKEVLIELNNQLDEEIKLYSQFEEDTFVKKEILIKAKLEELNKIDEKMLLSKEELEKTINKRKEINKKFGKENIELKDIIEKTRSIDSKLTQQIETKRKKINEIIKNLKKLGVINADLLTHALTVVGDKINIIAKSLNHEGNNLTSYNQKGNIQNSDNVTSSIIREA